MQDNTTGNNILWATENYKQYDDGQIENQRFGSQCEITSDIIMIDNVDIINRRHDKTADNQKKRTKDKAEVFTPSWICNEMNNLIDNTWFGFDNAFNFEEVKGWSHNTKLIDFAKSGKSWQDYVLDRRVEITCGEAPYLVSRYDTITGMPISIERRIGILDRKIRVINESIKADKDDGEWFEWVKKAYQNTYGFEWQGDSLIIARTNMLDTFYDYYQARFGYVPAMEYLVAIAEIISWNIWQMDGLKLVVPNTCNSNNQNAGICDGCKKNNRSKHNGTYCLIKDWKDEGRIIRFVDAVVGSYNRLLCEV